MVNFVLIAHERSGSTLLWRSLADHRNICMYGELFHDEEAERKRTFRAGDPERNLFYGGRYYRDGENGAHFLRTTVFYDPEWKILRAIGFKLFYQQARKDLSAKSTWHYLLEDKQVHIVHLWRRNLLECYLSQQLAIRTNVWVRLRNGRARRSLNLKSFSLDPKACEWYFREITAYRRWASLSFRSHPLLEIEYERDVCGRFQEMMSDIYNHLKVPRKRARKFLEKQARYKPAEQLSNYEELKEYFRHTPYEEFFVS